MTCSSIVGSETGDEKTLLRKEGRKAVEATHRTDQNSNMKAEMDKDQVGTWKTSLLFHLICHVGVLYLICAIVSAVFELTEMIFQVVRYSICTSGDSPVYD